MISFFRNNNNQIYAVDSKNPISQNDVKKLVWLFGNSKFLKTKIIESTFIGPRKTMVTPWSTNAVEITKNMGIEFIDRIELFNPADEDDVFDYMISEKYLKLDQELFKISRNPDKRLDINNINQYNLSEGLALNDDEIIYLESLSKKIGRKLTDSEVFGFSQVNSEHCRHKIFNGRFIIDETEMDESLFDLIKKTTKLNKNSVVSAYKDNVAFIEGPVIQQFAPIKPETQSKYKLSKFKSVISLKAETHNFPTTVEPFSGAATGSGGEIRDRMAGGQGSIPLAGTAVYMTPYPRFNDSTFGFKKREWLYQKPREILVKASNGASDFGNKFGQPLIAGSLFTFEHQENGKSWGYDKVIMLAGGIGYGKKEYALKSKLSKGDLIIVLGGDNYRIGMGGASVSSTNTGEYSSGIELNAVQRSNPEMQKRVFNVIRSILESEENFIKSIHDHGAGGHLNCLSELVENVGGLIDINKLPIGDKTLSEKEIIGNESQERMGIVIEGKYLNKLEQICLRENAPYYVVGVVTEDKRFSVKSWDKDEYTIDLEIDDFFGNSPKTIMKDNSEKMVFTDHEFKSQNLKNYLDKILKLESVSCKDWLTNKVDRCVTGKVALQQCTGPYQLPLNNCGVVALDYESKYGIATSIGHSPTTALINPAAGSRNSVGEALTNIIWAPLKNGLNSVSLSANWMWPANNIGENNRLYTAVKACSDFCIELGINVPTGKDSMSMKQKYKTGEVLSPGTVIISATAEVSDVSKCVEPFFKKFNSNIYYIDMSSCALNLGGSALMQSNNKIGNKSNDILNAKYFKKVFNVIQKLITDEKIYSGHDVSSGGLITTILEMSFVSSGIGLELFLNEFDENDLIKILFAENHALVIEAEKTIESHFIDNNIKFLNIGKTVNSNDIKIQKDEKNYTLNIDDYRKKWFDKSLTLDSIQSGSEYAKKRYTNLKSNQLKFKFPKWFDGLFKKINNNKIKAAILREKGSNSEREMAYAMYVSGFDVIDVHMTDLMSGRENLGNIKFLVAVGGFSNSDVLGSAKGWAGTFLYNEKAKKSLKNFYSKKNNLSLGVCNGCQLFMELGLITVDSKSKTFMDHNDSGKFECVFTSVEIEKNNSIMFKNFEDTNLGIWSAHGEGKFILPGEETDYNIIGKYSKNSFPSNPNGSDFNTAILANKDGRHIAMMPHLERSLFPWNWGFYPKNKSSHTISPWIQAFKNAYEWLKFN